MVLMEPSDLRLGQLVGVLCFIIDGIMTLTILIVPLSVKLLADIWTRLPRPSPYFQ